MRITVNKEARKERMNNEIDRTIKIAKDKAEQGLKYFTVTYPDGVDLYAISDHVSSRTDGTVYCIPRGLCNRTLSIKYSIKS